MKKLILILLFVFIISNEAPNLLASNEIYEETKKKYYNILRNQISKYKTGYPLGFGKLISNIVSNTQLYHGTVDINNLNSFRYKYSLPNDLIEKFQKLRYIKNEVVYDVFQHKHTVSKTAVENLFGLGTKLDEKTIFYIFYKGKTSADPLIKKTTYKVRKCKSFLFFTSCDTKDVIEGRDYYDHELKQIQDALTARFYELLDNVADDEKRNIIDLMKDAALKHQIPYPSSYSHLIVNINPQIDLKSDFISIHEIYKLRNKYGFPQTIVNQINSIKYQIGKSIVINQVVYENIKDGMLNITFGVALRLKNGISFYIAKGESYGKTLLNVCYNYSQNLFFLFAPKDVKATLEYNKLPQYFKDLCNKYLDRVGRDGLKNDYNRGYYGKDYETIKNALKYELMNAIKNEVNKNFYTK